MSIWYNPPPLYKGRDVFIIGGGPSLQSFNFNLLQNKNTIGCNSAFRLGVDICDICVFGDEGFFDNYHRELAEYAGTVVTIHPGICRREGNTWLKKMQRETSGLHTGTSLGWNGNTGATAINLALSMGAQRVFLLGFDMALSSAGKPNWHTYVIDKPNAVVYDRFIRGYADVKRDWLKLFPGTEIINLNPSSALLEFPKRPLNVFLEEGVRNDVRRPMQAEVGPSA